MTDSERLRATTCIFCGGGPLTREHIVGRWITRLLVEIEPPDETWTSRNYIGGLTERDREHSVAIPEVERQIVCEACNQGWMSQLQADAKPILSPMILASESVALGPAEQILIATWAATMCMSYEWWEPVKDGFLFTDDQRHALRESQHPPAWLRVRLAYRNPWDTAISIHCFLAKAKRETQGQADVICATFGIGFLIVQVYGGPPFGDQLGTSLGSELPQERVWDSSERTAQHGRARNC